MLTKLNFQKKYDFVWSIAQRVGINVTVITSVDVVGVCIFKVAPTVYQVQIPNLDPSYCFHGHIGCYKIILLYKIVSYQRGTNSVSKTSLL